MKKTTSILPCPFCGSANVGVGEIVYTRNKAVACGDCSAEGPPSTKKAEAIRLWNTRVQL